MPPPVTAHYERPPTPHLGTAASVSQFHTASSLTNFPCYRALAKQSAAGRRPGEYACEHKRGTQGALACYSALYIPGLK
eukprot:868400-Pelagomonas_calceolata.AAC.3